MKRILNPTTILCLALPMLAPAGVYGHNPEKYAKNSVLSNGQWVRAEILEGGMQFISGSALSKAGLDASRVNVYGYGGAPLPDQLSETDPDDLPMLPSIRVNGGILFYAPDNVSWTRTKSKDDAKKDSSMEFFHKTNIYSETGYVYLSDRALEEGEGDIFFKGNYASTGGTPASTFTARVLHEQELTQPSPFGGDFLGEDFRAQSARTIQIPLPGNTGDARFRLVFGASISSGRLSLSMNANGQALPSSSSDAILPLTSSSEYLKTTSTIKDVPNAGDNLRLTIDASTSGVVSIAALDYVEVEYERVLDCSAGPLHFYTNVKDETTFEISGVTDWTRIWDITTPTRPIEVSFVRSGSKALFTPPQRGDREYIVFGEGETAKAHTPGALQSVGNQNLHAAENPDMVIITPLRYQLQANAVADLHRNVDGMKVLVVSPQEIYNEFSSGTPHPTAFRRLLKMFRDRAEADPSLAETRYCLMFGRAVCDNRRLSPETVNAGFPILPTWVSTQKFSETTAYSTDDFIGMTDDSDFDFNIEKQKIRVAVGRFPHSSEEEASVLVEKLTEYVTKPEFGNWRNNVMLIADDQDGGAHLNQTETLHKGMTSSGNGSNFVYQKLYLDSYPLVATATGNTYPAAKEDMLRNWNDGVSWINYIGHASPTSWSHEKLLTWTDINSFSNRRLPFLYTATCSFGRHDTFETSGAEVLTLNPQGGVIATVSPLRTVYIDKNGVLTRCVGPYIFARDKDGRASRIGDIVRQAKNAVPSEDSNKLRFALLGDPAMRIVSPDYESVVEQIGDVVTEGLADSDLPVVGARGRVKVKGSVRDAEGNIVSDFNGRLEAILFDAERVVETYGNGTNGIVSNYNDRKTRLFQGATTVKDGRWELTLLMPAEIENNFSPALLSTYAYSESGKEANGGCDRLYVYGVADDAPDDSEGPSILQFTLNHDNFQPGDITHPDPTVMATVSDPSGINVSEIGVGHKMLLTLDGKKYYEDLGTFYTSDPEIEGGGTLVYPLSDIEPGEHYLELTVWDNANNSSTSRLPFRVGINRDIDLVELRSDASPAHDKTMFTILTDRALSDILYEIEVFDLGGASVWSSGRTSKSRMDGSVSHTWYLTDRNGTRVPRGIYICRARIESAEGVSTSKSIRIAVAAQ